MNKTGANKSFMDTLTMVFKNVWLKRGVALLLWGYTGLLAWIAWLNATFFLEYENPTPLFVLYVFINVAALALLIYTRRQVLTQINVMLMPPIVFLSFLLAFGNWYMIVPPLVVIVVMFFVCTANETLKTVLGTMYLLMFVVGGAAYITITLLMGKISLTGVDLALRDTEYEKLSADGCYRIVRYVDKPNGDRRTASYYVEDVSLDSDIPFGSAKRVLGCERVVTSNYTSKDNDPVKWVIRTVDGKNVEMLDVEGVVRENPYLAEDVVITDETDEPDIATSVPDTAEISSQAADVSVETVSE